MAITITKQKQKQEAAQLPKVEDGISIKDCSLEELVDQYGSLGDQVAALNADPRHVKFGLVRNELVTRLQAMTEDEEEDLEPEDSLTLEGHKWLLEIGACAKNPRKLKEGAALLLINMLGQEDASKILKANVGDIDKYCTPDQAAEVLDTDTGYSKNRTIVSKYIGGK